MLYNMTTAPSRKRSSSSVRELLHDERKQRLVFAIGYTIFFIMFVYEATNIIIVYRERQTTTAVTFDCGHDEEPLPYVQVCTQYFTNRSRLPEWNVSQELFEYMKSGFLGFNNYKGARNEKYNPVDGVQQEFEFLMRQRPDFDYRHFFRDVALRRIKVIGYCKWAEESIDCDAIFQQVFTPSGLCYLLRSERAPKQHIPGPGGGLRFLVAIRRHFEPNGTVYNTGFDDGVHVSLNGEWNPYVTNPIFIAAGKRAYIQVRRTEIVREPTASQCQPTGRRLQFFDEAYTHSGCLYDCYVEYSLHHCGCSAFTYDVQLPAAKLCTPQQFRNCMRPLLHRLEKDVYRNCSKKCPQSCVSSEVATSVSYTNVDRLRVDAYNQRRNRQWDPTETIMMHIYYSKIGHTHISEHLVMTRDTAVANIGGQLSLWLGFSALSLTAFLHNYLQRRGKAFKDQPISISTQKFSSISSIKKNGNNTTVQPNTTHGFHVMSPSSAPSVAGSIASRFKQRFKQFQKNNQFSVNKTCEVQSITVKSKMPAVTD